VGRALSPWVVKEVLWGPRWGPAGLRLKCRGERLRGLPHADRVGMMSEVGRTGEHRPDPGKLPRGSGPDKHPHLPQASLAERVQLREPAYRPVGTEPERFLVMLAQHRHPGAQAGHL